jgi:hypothetical protein
MKFLIPAFVAAAFAQPLAACDLCALYSASQARGEVGQGAFAGVAEQFSHFGTVQVDGRNVFDPSGQYLDSSISQVFAGYNFNQRFGLQFSVPVIYRSFKRPDSVGGIDQGTESGIGDVALLGTFVVYQKLEENFTFNWNLLGGVKFPTGSSDRIKEELNEVEDPVGPPSGIHGHDLTLGTGSYDGIVGSGIFTRWHRGFLSANVQYAIRSKGDFDYQFANDLTWSGGPGYYVALTHKNTLSLQAVVSGEYKRKDTFRGQSAEDTGVTAVYLGPQVNFTWGGSLAAYLAADLPMSIENTSLQTVPDYRIRAGVSWHF